MPSTLLFRDEPDPEVASRDPSAPAPMPLAVRGGLVVAAFVLAVFGGLAAASYWNDGTPSTFAVLPIAEPYAARAEALLTQPHPSKSNLDAAERAVRKELEIAPRRTDGYLRLAIIEVMRDGGLTVPGLRAIQQSYVYAPLDPDYFVARIRFCLEHWGELDDATRVKVAREIAVSSKYRPSAKLRDVVLAVQNPQGRFGGLLSLSLDSVHIPQVKDANGDVVREGEGARDR